MGPNGRGRDNHGLELPTQVPDRGEYVKLPGTDLKERLADVPSADGWDAPGKAPAPGFFEATRGRKIAAPVFSEPQPL